MGRIGKTAVEATPRPQAGHRSVLWDSEAKGFGVRVASNGKRTYVLRYRMRGRESPQRYLTIGRHGSTMTADQARRRACELLIVVHSGIDPAAERRKVSSDAVATADLRAERMFDILVERWLDEHVRGKLRSERDIEGVVGVT